MGQERLNKFDGMTGAGFNALAHALPVNYDSQVNFFGAEWGEDAQGRLFYNPDTFMGRVDYALDPIARMCEDHYSGIARKALESLDLVKAYRAQPSAIRSKSIKHLQQNILTLKLDNAYRIEGNTVIVIDAHTFRESVNLHDIFRGDVIQKDTTIKEIDRVAAVQSVAAYLWEMHSQYGPIGQAHTADFMLSRTGKQLNGGVFLNIPEVGYNPTSTTRITPFMKKAFELTDLIYTAGHEEYARVLRDHVSTPKDYTIATALNSAATILDTILEVYGQTPEGRKVIRMCQMITSLGVVSLKGDKAGNISVFERFFRDHLFAYHNTVRLNINEQSSQIMRQLLRDAVDRYLRKNTLASHTTQTSSAR